jgi:HK97 family phage prohead protease
MPVRELRTGDEGKIEGYAAVFNEETVIGGWFRERIEPGAFARAIKEKQDVRALFNHNADYVLGRTTAKTLALQEDKRGLWMEVDPPNTQFAHDLMESIRRGDISEMSFAFIVPGRDGEEWDESETKNGKLPLRIIRDVDLFDVSPVTYPAYEGTSVGLRSAESIYQDHIQSLEGQAPEGDDDAEQSEQELDRVRAIVEVMKLKTNER